MPPGRGPGRAAAQAVRGRRPRFPYDRRHVSSPTPPFTEEHEELRESVRGFLKRELAPHAERWEEERWFPNEVFATLAGQGLLGLKYPVEYGGQGGDYLLEPVLFGGLARRGPRGTAARLGAPSTIP